MDPSAGAVLARADVAADRKAKHGLPSKDTCPRRLGLWIRPEAPSAFTSLPRRLPVKLDVQRYISRAGGSSRLGGTRGGVRAPWLAPTNSGSGENGRVSARRGAARWGGLVADLIAF